MQTYTLKQNIVRKLLLLILPVLALVGFAAPSAQADDHWHRGGYRHAYRGGYYRGGGYRHGYYGYHGYRGRRGYWRYYHGRRYWYEDGGFFLYPGGTSINIVL